MQLNRDNNVIEDVRNRLSVASSVTILTGAGISAESGVPTFRGEDGLWRNYRAEELATPQAFKRDPVLVWEWYNMRRERLSDIEPNQAHYALARLEKRVGDFTLITQNVDGLHEKGGSRNIIELHGNIWRVRCTGCGGIKDNHDVPIDILPYCVDCGGLLRPHIVWFGEMLPDDVLSSAYSALEICKIMIVVGTSGIVQPAASMAYTAKRAGAYVIEVNLEMTPNSGIVDRTIIGKAAEILPLLI
ncbi:MAG: NAD-dependent deacylase [Thermodesulfobacteriota bacterium]